jgi:hypothetical protein
MLLMQSSVPKAAEPDMSESRMLPLPHLTRLPIDAASSWELQVEPSPILNDRRARRSCCTPLTIKKYRQFGSIVPSGKRSLGRSAKYSAESLGGIRYHHTAITNR